MSIFPALFALALFPGTGGGLSPAFGTGGAPPIGTVVVVLVLPGISPPDGEVLVPTIGALRSFVSVFLNCLPF